MTIIVLFVQTHSQHTNLKGLQIMTQQALITPQAFIFDWDNTLVDSWDMIYDIVNHTLKTFRGEIWPMEKIKETTHLSAKDNFPKIFGAQAEEALIELRRYAEENHTHYLDSLKMMSGALDLLHYLKAKKIPCAIVSNKHAHRLRIEVEHMGLNDYFTAVYGSTDFPHDKPNPYPAERAIEANKIAAPYTWFVGDTPADWDCARNANCQPIAVGELTHLDDLPKTIFTDLNTLLNYLKIA